MFKTCLIVSRDSLMVKALCCGHRNPGSIPSLDNSTSFCERTNKTGSIVQG